MDNDWIVIYVRLDKRIYFRTSLTSRWSMWSSVHKFQGIHKQYVTVFTEDYESLPEEIQVAIQSITTSKESKIIDLGKEVRCGPN